MTRRSSGRSAIHALSDPRLSLRGLTLDGETAFGFLHGSGWRASGESDACAAVGDFERNGEFSLCRFRHTAAARERSGSRSRTPVRAPRAMILNCFEGSYTFGLDGARCAVVRGETIMFDPDALSSISCAEDSALLAMVYRVRKPVPFASLLPDSGHWQVLAATANALLSSRDQWSFTGYLHVQQALEILADALMAETLRGAAPRESREQIYAWAAMYIDAAFVLPETTVESVARRLGVSRSQLFRAFQQHDDSPSDYLRRTRADAARALLAAGAPPADAAWRSGFETVRRMRRALERPA